MVCHVGIDTAVASASDGYHTACAEIDKEVERLNAEVARLTEDLKVGELCEECEEFTNEPDGNPRTFTVCGVCWNKQQVKLSTARANAIDEAIAAVNAERLHENLDNEGDRGYMTAIRHCTAALEALKQKDRKDRKDD
jgi:hypothetical protein